MSDDWREVLTDKEKMLLALQESAIQGYVNDLASVRYGRRKLYLRAVQRLHRNKQKGVDKPLRKA